jgi:hypothetical protein
MEKAGYPQQLATYWSVTSALLSSFFVSVQPTSKWKARLYAFAGSILLSFTNSAGGPILHDERSEAAASDIPHRDGIFSQQTVHHRKPPCFLCFNFATASSRISWSRVYFQKLIVV